MKLLLVVILLISHFALEARDLAAIKKSGVFRVAVDGETPGFNYYKGKELVGLDVDVAAAIAKNLGLKIEWTAQNFNTLLVALGQDRFDMIATAHAITDERSKVADFVDPHYCTGAMVVSKKGGPKTQADLTGKVVAVPTGTVYYQYLAKLPAIKQVKTFPSETAGLQDLLNNRSDAWVSDEMVAGEVLKTHSDLQGGAVLFPQRNAMVVAKGNRALRDAVNQEIKRLMSDGTFATLSKKHFGRDIRCK